MDQKLKRLACMLPEEKLEQLKTKKVLICGCGGVGSFVAEALARSGVGHLTLVDFDVVEESNLNRQLMTDKNNIGTLKTEALKNHLEAISDVQVETINIVIDENFTLEDYDYIIDCVDDLKAKFALAKKAHFKKIPFIASMGTAKRLAIGDVVYTTLDKTRNDPLAKAYRGLVKKADYHNPIRVVYCDSAPLEMQNGDNRQLGSAIFTVGSVGLKIASIVFLKLIKE